MLREFRSFGMMLLTGVLSSPVVDVSAADTARGTQRASAQVRQPVAKAETYTVQPGDTLYSLARTRGSTVGAVMAANGLRTDQLRVGQRLRLPVLTLVQMSLREPNPAASAQVRGEEAAELSEPREATQQAGIVPLLPQSVRSRLVSAGLELLGIRYRRSGASERTGFDCSGLVQNLFGRFGVRLPRSSREQYKEGVEVPPGRFEAGDLIFFTSSRRRVPNHVAIYIGEDRILHALSGARKVTVSSTASSWFRRRFLGARRIPELWVDEQLLAETGGDR